MLTIYDSNGNRRTDIEAGDSSTQVKEVQGDNVLTLSFTHYEYIALDVNDRVDFEGERYWLTERYIPKQKSGQEWVYDLKFYGYREPGETFSCAGDHRREHRACVHADSDSA